MREESKTKPALTVAALAALVGGTWEGDGSVPIRGVAGVTEAREGDVSFIDKAEFATEIDRCKATVLIVGPDLETSFRPLIRTPNPRLAFIKAMEAILGRRKCTPGVHPTAVIGEGVRLGRDVSIQAHATLNDGCEIGDEAVIYSGTCIGTGSRIGAGSLIYANVTVGSGVAIGRNVILHSGTSIGHSLDEPGTGRTDHTILEDDVEVGANCVIARGAPGAPTVIGAGTKTDNLVQIAPGVRIGRNCILVAQVSLDRSVILEEGVTIAGQAHVAPHVRIGAAATIGARSVVQEDVPPGATYSGAPARDHDTERKLKAHISRLPQTQSRIALLERVLGQRDAGKSERT